MNVGCAIGFDQGKVMRALGLMSGTSMDGIDLALIETDGASHVHRIASASVAYADDFRAQLRQALTDAKPITSREQRPGSLAAIERQLTERHAHAALSFLRDQMLQPIAIDVIGFHGQTVLHRPEARLTLQLGDGPMLAARTNIDVVYDLRAADVAAGGQGAPLVPVYHQALAVKAPLRPVAFVNIGGVANITWIGADGRLIAFDTGPGNALVDDWMARRTGTPFDADGAMAAQGRVLEALLRTYMLDPYFARLPPKSLDRQAFHGLALGNISTTDGAATLTAVTAQAITRAREHLPEEPALWVVCGGGRRNRTLMRLIAAAVENAVVPAEALGFDGDTMEAEAWGYLAVRSLLGLPITFPGTTGVPLPMTGGVLAKARDSATPV